MKVHLPNILPANFHPQSKVWIYQSNRLFTMPEIFQIEPFLENFADNWQSHGARVKGFATVLYGQFIVIMADESATTVGGCSTDSSVRVIKEIENTYQVSMFNRTNLAFVIKEKIQLLPLSQVNYAIENGFIDADTLFIDNNVPDKQSLLNRWIIPVKESWLAKKLTFINQQ